MPLLHDARSFDRRSTVLNDSCEIREPDVETTFNESTLEQGWRSGQVLYSGACEVQGPRLIADRPQGEMLLAVDDVNIRIPRSVNGVEPRMIVEITSSCDQSLVGVEFEVRRTVERSVGFTRSLVCRGYQSQSRVRSVPGA